ncbi:MAG: hypothetical protein EXX96DRAFT_119820 [Benjaminiella poitrasii]|nr:MAG: hypothetical protein EXX96DRAFT_119820 [Benjaminiella poitrasii]
MEKIADTVKLERKVYNKHSNEQKFLFVYRNRIKLFNATKSERTARRLKEDKGRNILEKLTNLVNRPKSQL